jgi:hypothetical protein
MTHFSILLNIPIRKAWNYYRNIPAYVRHYPFYCADIRVLERNRNRLKTREIWNLPLGDRGDAVIEVNYLMLPMKEIQYEIVDGFCAGTKNSIKFEDRDGQKTDLSADLPPLDIVRTLIPKEKDYSDNYDQMITYIVRSDGKLLEGKYKGMFAAGQKCKSCKKGKLIHWGRARSETGDRREARAEESFRCEYCGKTFSNFDLQVREGIGVRG